MIVYTTDTQLLEAGATPYTLGTGAFWYNRVEGSYDTSKIHLPQVDRYIELFNDKPGPFLADIEAFSFSSDFDYAVSQFKLALTCWQIKSNREIGVYAYMPMRNWFEPVRIFQLLNKEDLGGPTRTWVPCCIRYNNWKNLNTRIAQELIEYVDYLCPSLYAFYPERTHQWNVYAHENLQEAFRISNGKPVRPILWPVFHSSKTPIPLDVWEEMVHFIYKYPNINEMFLYAPTSIEMDPNWREPILNVMSKGSPPIA